MKSLLGECSLNYCIVKKNGIYAADRNRWFKRQHRPAETSSIQPEPTTKKQLKFDKHVVQERADCLSYSSSCSVSNQLTEVLQVNPVSPWPQSKDSSLQLVYNAFGFPSMPLSVCICWSDIIWPSIYFKPNHETLLPETFFK